MSKLNDRENAFENKYAHDEKMNFKIEARASKLFGLWAAARMGLSGENAMNYAGDIIASNIDKPGFKNFGPKVKADLTAKGIDITDHALQVEFDKILEDAQDQIQSETQ